MKYFDEELAARIEMRDIASVQERIKRFDCADDYELEEAPHHALSLWASAHDIAVDDRSWARV
jgi:hypothetical protein